MELQVVMKIGDLFFAAIICGYSKYMDIYARTKSVYHVYIYDRYSQDYVCVYDVFVLLYLVLELQILDWESLYFAFVLWLIIACYPH